MDIYYIVNGQDQLAELEDKVETLSSLIEIESSKLESKYTYDQPILIRKKKEMVPSREIYLITPLPECTIRVVQKQNLPLDTLKIDPAGLEFSIGEDHYEIRFK